MVFEKNENKKLRSLCIGVYMIVSVRKTFASLKKQLTFQKKYATIFKIKNGSVPLY